MTPFWTGVLVGTGVTALVMAIAIVTLIVLVTLRKERA